MQVMHREFNRLATYVDWPQSSGASPSRLARSGFYATGDGDTTVCFSCQSSVSQWQSGDDPKQKHRREPPTCSMVNGQNSTNIAMVALCDNFDAGVVPDRLSKNGDVGRSSSRAGRDVRDSAADESPVPELYKTCRSALNRAKQKGVLDTDEPATAPAVSRPAPPQVVDLENPDFELLRHEAARLATFTNFITTSQVTAPALAKAGFFYKGPRDRVQCPFCQVLLRNWVDGDDPMTEHRRHMPACPFLNDAARCGNVRIEDDSVDTYTVTQGSTHTTDSQGSQVRICLMESSVSFNNFYSWQCCELEFVTCMSGAGSDDKFIGTECGVKNKSQRKFKFPVNDIFYITRLCTINVGSC